MNSFQIRYLEEHTDLYRADIDVGIVLIKCLGRDMQ